MTPHPRVCLSLLVSLFQSALHHAARQRAAALAVAGAALVFSVSPVSAQSIDGGLEHTVVVKPDGTVWVWGSNSNGQLGNGSTSPTHRKVPDQVPGLANVTAVAAGTQHTLVLLSDGSVWAWGANGSGQLGDGTTTLRRSPVPVDNLTSGVIAIAAGTSFSMALKSDGTVHTWGSDSVGELGDGASGANTLSPAQVLTGITAIAAGSYHGLAVKNDGTVLAWGQNTQGQLGDNSQTNRSTPVQMQGVSAASKVAAGHQHSLILMTDGTVMGTGYNNMGELGLGAGQPARRTTAAAIANFSNVIHVTAGDAYSLALKGDGTVWTWGTNSYLQLGGGPTAPSFRSTPGQVVTITDAVLLGAGTRHAITASATGVVRTFGLNNFDGLLGDGTITARHTPIDISDAAYLWKVGTPVFDVAAGLYYEDKSVTVTSETPDADIHYTLDGNDPTTSDPIVISGQDVVVDETATLKARAWKTGHGTSHVASASYTLKVMTPAFTPMPSPSNTPLTAPVNVAIGTNPTTNTTIRFTTDGSAPTASSALYTGPINIATRTQLRARGFRSGWADSDATTYNTYYFNYGNLTTPTASHPTGTYPTSVTVTLTSPEPYAAIRYTIRTDGGTPSDPTESSTLYTGPLQFTQTTRMKAKAFHNDYTPSGVFSGDYTIVVDTPTLTPGGGTYTAGQAITVATTTPGATMYYTLNGAEPTISDPVIASGGTLVAGNFTVKVKAIKTGLTPSATVTGAYAVTGSVTSYLVSMGTNHALAARTDGAMFAWGSNGARQLGDGSTPPVDQPIATSVVALTGAVSIAAYGSSSWAVRSTGDVVAWGSNSQGRLGIGNSNAQTLPVIIPGLTNATSIASGDTHTLVRKSDGTVVAWGQNTQGQLGTGSTGSTLQSPTAVTVVTDITAVATGVRHSLARKNDGTVWSWGDSDGGVLGNGVSGGYYPTPAQVPGLTNVTAIAAGHFTSFAVKGDGTVWAWGINTGGQLGDNSTQMRTSPVQVSGLTGVIAIAAGGNHTAALKNDGTVWIWGSNASGALGQGQVGGPNQLLPIQVPGLTSIIKISAAPTQTVAVSTDGSVWSWGDNASRELGDGTTTTRPSPVPIAGPGMNWKARTPTLTGPGSGTYFSAFTVTATANEAGTTLHYTLNGVDPTDSDPTVTSGGTIAINESGTLKLAAFKTGAPTSVIVANVYAFKVTAPVMSPGTGTYGTPPSVTLSTTTPGATIRYTLDSSDPDITSTAYSASLTITSSLTLKARAFKSGWTPSDAGYASYWVPEGTVLAPVITPAAGTYTDHVLVSMSSPTAGATIRYTLDGTTPTFTSPAYQNVPLVVSSTTTVTAKAFRSGLTASTVASAAYALDAAGAVATPLITPAGGRYLTKQTVTITGAAGATLRYTVNGVDPTASDTAITSGNTIVVDTSQVVKVRAFQSGLTDSAVRRADFAITGAIVAESVHAGALKTDGTVWTWGFMNVSLGDGWITQRLAPGQVATGAIALATGLTHYLIVKSDGTVWGWGDNGSGRLGLPLGPSQSGASVPTQAAALTNVVAVAAGHQHSLALKADGTVWAFGSNQYGQVGNNSSSIAYTPVQVPGLSGVTAIAAGDEFSLAEQRRRG